MPEPLKRNQARASQTDNLFGVDISQGLNSVVRQAAKVFSSDPSNNRREEAGLSKGGVRTNITSNTRAKFANEDWRVRISIAPQANYLYGDKNNKILSPLILTNGMIFPYTPQVMLGSTASYSSQTPTHSNYAQPFFGNSMVFL